MEESGPQGKAEEGDPAEAKALEVWTDEAEPERAADGGAVDARRRVPDFGG